MHQSNLVGEKSDIETRNQEDGEVSNTGKVDGESNATLTRNQGQCTYFYIIGIQGARQRARSGEARAGQNDIFKAYKNRKSL